MYTPDSRKRVETIDLEFRVYNVKCNGWKRDKFIYSQMAKLLLLPGNNLENKEWIEEVSEAFAQDFSERKTLYYQHWGNNSGSIDFEVELIRLQELVGEWGNEEYYVFAKSAGIILTMLAEQKGILKPRGCMFVGFPYFFAQKQGYVPKELLSNHLIPTVFVQKKFDPAYPAKLLDDLLSLVYPRGYILECVPGANHHYENIKELVVFFKKGLM